MDDTPRQVWADGEVYPLGEWGLPVRKQIALGASVDCARCGSTMLQNYYAIRHLSEPLSIAVCVTCCLVLQSSEAISPLVHVYKWGAKEQRKALIADFRDPAQWRAAQFALTMPNYKGVVVEGAMIELDDYEAWVQIANFEGMWFWKGKFLDVFRGKDDFFATFDEAADHALKELLFWFDN